MTTVFLELNRVNIISATVVRVIKRAAKLGHTLARRRKQARIVSELRSLTDRELRDIGIHRTEIMSIAAGVDADRTRRCRRHQ